VYSFGEEHEAKSAPSSEHSKVESGLSAEKVKFAVELVVIASGRESIVVSGAVTADGSTVHW
jgi:hypothetical protein